MSEPDDLTHYMEAASQLARKCVDFEEAVRRHLLVLDQHSAAEIDPAIRATAQSLAALLEKGSTR